MKGQGYQSHEGGGRGGVGLQKESDPQEEADIEAEDWDDVEDGIEEEFEDDDFEEPED